MTKKTKTTLKKENSLKIKIKKFITKETIFYFILLVLDIAIIIYSARHNYANYVSLDNTKKVFVGKTKHLLFGKNYITLITTIFFYVYILLSNKILFHKKNKKKFIVTTALILLILNITLFYLFTKRIY
jgi:hypothetical protein